MNIAIVEYYVPSCGACIAIVENIVQSAIRDVSVSHTKLVAGNRHCHEVEAKNALPIANPDPAKNPEPSLFAAVNGAAAPLPNGFDAILQAG